MPDQKSDADDKLRQGQTVKEALDRCVEIIRSRQGVVSSSATLTNTGPIMREYALAITAIEDAQMRYTRGRAMQLGKFNPADLDASA